MATSAPLIVRRGGPRYGPPASSSEGGYAPLGLPRPSLGRAPAQPWRASGLTQDVSSSRLSRGPVATIDEDFPVRRHARLGEADGALEPQLHTDHLLHPVLAEVRVLRGERRPRIDAHHVGLDGLRRRRVEIHARRLVHADAPDLPFGHECPQIDLAEVHERNDGRARHHDLAGLGRSRGDRAVERRDDAEVLSVRARFFELSPRALGLRLRGGDVGLRLEDLALHGRDLGRANGRVDEIRLRRRERAARRFDLAPLRADDRRLRLLVVLGSLRFLLGDQLLFEQARHGLPVPLRLRVRALGLGELRLRRRELALRLVHAALGIGARLIHAEPALPQRLVEHGDLVLGQTRSRLGLPDSGGWPGPPPPPPPPPRPRGPPPPPPPAALPPRELANSG